MGIIDLPLKKQYGMTSRSMRDSRGKEVIMIDQHDIRLTQTVTGAG